MMVKVVINNVVINSKFFAQDGAFNDSVICDYIKNGSVDKIHSLALVATEHLKTISDGDIYDVVVKDLTCKMHFYDINNHHIVTCDAWLVDEQLSIKLPDYLIIGEDGFKNIGFELISGTIDYLQDLTMVQCMRMLSDDFKNAGVMRLALKLRNIFADATNNNFKNTH
ncbi:hypothetical protein ACEUA8_01375 [Aeromonas veronii]